MCSARWFEIIAPRCPRGIFGRVTMGMRRYNPKLEDFGWREVPNTDEEAHSLLQGYAGAEGHAAVYEEWRRLGAGVMAALIRAGEAARGEEGRGG